MSTFLSLSKRNIKLFFKDKGMFLTSLITPLILILLFVTFLGNIYRESFLSILPDGVSVPQELVEGFVGGWLFSSLLAVSCVTVAFCSNLLMVQDKISGAYGDIAITPVKRSTVAVSYYVASLSATLIICGVALAVCFIYLASTGWYLSVADVLLTVLDVVLLVMFGTALSSVINFNLSTQGQGSAVGTIVSSCYGFICGAYMPISQFSDAIQIFISFLPGTYGTSLLHNHLMRGVMSELETYNLPSEVIGALKDGFDSNVYFFDNKVEIGTMYIIVVGAIALLLAAYVMMNIVKAKKKAK